MRPELGPLAKCPFCSGRGGAASPLLILAVLAVLGWVVQRVWATWKKEGTLRMNNVGKIAIVAVLAAVVVAVVLLKPRGSSTSKDGKASTSTPAERVAGLPRLIDLGAGKCIPCKMMAPILADLKKTYAGRLQVDLVDVNEDPETAAKLAVTIIPTQIFLDAEGKELFRHEGFMSKEDILAKWKELGVDLALPSVPSGISRQIALVEDKRPRDRVCFMCERDVEAKSRTVVETEGGAVILCSPHCFFIYYSSLWTPQGVDRMACVTDWVTESTTPASSAVYLYGADARGRPTIRAFTQKDAATKEQQKSGGNLLTWELLRAKELAVRCGFCGRANYPEDANPVKAGPLQMHACCPMCALGVAARLQQDIEVEAKDGLTGEPIHLASWNGHVQTLEPKTAVAWHGQRKGPDGKMASAGCFHQYFFASEANLRQWIDKHPEATGKMMTIEQALAAKMKMSADQIRRACKIGECPTDK